MQRRIMLYVQYFFLWLNCTCCENKSTEMKHNWNSPLHSFNFNVQVVWTAELEVLHLQSGSENVKQKSSLLLKPKFRWNSWMTKWIWCTLYTVHTYSYMLHDAGYRYKIRHVLFISYHAGVPCLLLHVQCWHKWNSKLTSAIWHRLQTRKLIFNIEYRHST